MGWVLARPSVTALEVLWRWLFGLPMLAVCWLQAQKILAELPPESTGLTSLDPGNPWISAMKLAAAWKLYEPRVAAISVWLVPAVILAWSVLSGLGRNLVLRRMEPAIPLRAGAMIVLQAFRAAAFAGAWFCWYAGVKWAIVSHISTVAEPDLVGFTIWMVFITLGCVAVWAALSWMVTVAPILAMLEGCGVGAALARSLRLGRPFTAKLIEINFVMSIVKLALIVVAMVFSSVLIPFAEEVGAGALHVEWIVVGLFYFIANDYFQIVRLKGFLEFWKLYRSAAA
jgi:hypothetical protein